ncbi:hypothetical protein [Massilia rubra]|uniref:Uncharacterized protein n=1 Tax=Massilia rubra TaxID=2607910 RepID=A0ABX0LKK4_9BURK|nr:hypothetical protein [Massilia rubra]NHZ34730.1 hypothetical protein [Massilia rubra]
MSSTAFDILAIADTFTPVRKKNSRTRLELLAHRILRYSFLLALGLFAIALLFLAWHQFRSPLSGLEVDIVRGLTLGTLFMLFLCLGALAVEVMCWAVALKRSLWRGFVSELQWDLGQAGQLDQFDKKDLKRACEFLELRTNRARERIKSFVGGTDKLALLVLLAGAWAVYKEVPWRTSLFRADWADPAYFPGTALFLLFVFGMGTITGAVILNFQVQRYVYQLEVLKLQLSTRD